MAELANLPAERIVVGGIIKHGFEAFLDADDIVLVSSFSNETNRLVYQCLQYIYEHNPKSIASPPEIISAAKHLGYGDYFSNQAQVQHLKALINTDVDINAVAQSAGSVRKLEITRLLIEQLDRSKSTLKEVTGDETLGEILGLVEAPIFDFTINLGDSSFDGPKRIGLGIEEYLDERIRNPSEMVGLSSGFGLYDQSIGGGFRRKTVSLIAARPKVGKTILVSNVAQHVSGVVGVPVLNLDTEMSEEDQWARNLAMMTEITIDDIETGKFSKDDDKIAKLREAASKLEHTNYFYRSVAGQQMEETLGLMRRWIMKEVGTTDGRTNDCLIIYDYLKLMDATGLEALQEYQRLGFLVTALHNFAVKYDVPILIISQLNRDGVNRESTDVISGSDRVVWLVSNFTIFKVKSSEEIAEDGRQYGDRKFVPIVSRHGAGLDDGDYIHVIFQGEFAKITENSTRNNSHGLANAYDSGFGTDDE